MSYLEIAEALFSTLAEVEVHIYRARYNLRKTLEHCREENCPEPEDISAYVDGESAADRIAFLSAHLDGGADGNRVDRGLFAVGGELQAIRWEVNRYELVSAGAPILPRG